MPMISVTLRPGVNTELTPSVNEAGVYQSQLIRYREGMIQPIGGWEQYITVTSPSTVRDLHAWQDLNSEQRLAAGATQNLLVITDGAMNDITPQTYTSSFAPKFSTSSGSRVVTVEDAGSSASTLDTVYFNTPIAVGGTFLSGGYAINTVGGSSVYTILSSAAATSTVTASGVLPTFAVSSGSGTITVTLPNNNYLSVPGLYYPFIAPTTLGGLTIQGSYSVSSIVDSTNFTISADSQSSVAASTTMNNGLAQLVYYIALGPQTTAGGYGQGAYGAGGYGIGTAISGGTGTPITVTDWTLDNWGDVLLAGVKDGAIYTWSAQSGLYTAQVIAQAPFFNGGIFVSMPQQILVAWKSCQSTGVQDPLLVRWCDAGNYTEWSVSNQTTAGSFRIPTGSVIRGGIQAPTQGVIWTDIDCWAMQYIGGDAIFNFTRIGSGCGLIGQHAMGQFNGQVLWCGESNFFMLSENGVQVLPCTVWDFIFQNLNTTYQDKIVCAVNSAFSEVSWFFPSAASTGENDSYVKFNMVEKAWDYGLLPRTAWQDVSVLGNPIATDASGYFYQHDTGNAISGVANPSFRSGWWSITEGNDLAFVDWVIPDFRWGTYAGSQDAQIAITFYVVDYPGDTPRVYGPYTVTQATEYINPRMRGRLMSVMIQGPNDQFWRTGRVRYRYAVSGRR